MFNSPPSSFAMRVVLFLLADAGRFCIVVALLLGDRVAAADDGRCLRSRGDGRETNGAASFEVGSFPEYVRMIVFTDLDDEVVCF